MHERQNFNRQERRSADSHMQQQVIEERFRLSKRKKMPIIYNINTFKVKDPEEVYQKYLEFVNNHHSVLSINKAK